MRREVLLHHRGIISRTIDVLMKTRLYGANATRSR
jgi:hypothetical protein